jgi:hypothetical protein
MSGKGKTSARLASGLIILNGVSRRLPVVHPKVRHGWGALQSVPEKGFTQSQVGATWRRIVTVTFRLAAVPSPNFLIRLSVNDCRRNPGGDRRAETR